MRYLIVFIFISTFSFAQTLEKKSSIISLPIDFSVDDIQLALNKNMPLVLLNDVSFDDNQKDELKAKITRKGDIVFSAINNDILTYEVPLKIWIQKRISALGLAQYPSTEFEIKFKFSSKFSLRSDYNIQTQTNAVGFEFITKPVIKTSIADIPVGPIISKVIDAKKTEYAAQIDKAIAENFQMRNLVIDTWNTASIPYLASEEYKTWIKITPQEIFATPFKSEKRNIKAVIGFKVQIETLVGQPSLDIKKAVNIPNLKMVNNIPSEFEVQLYTIVDYAAATDLAKKMFVNQKYEFKEGKYKIEIKDMQISQDEHKLLFKISTKGSFKGDIFINGIPVYDPVKNMVVLSKTELNIKTRNFLHKSAAWILEGFIEKKIESDFGMPLADIIAYSTENVNQSINKAFTPGISMSGKVLEVKPEAIYVDEKGMFATINAKAKVELKIKGL